MFDTKCCEALVSLIYTGLGQLLHGRVLDSFLVCLSCHDMALGLFFVHIVLVTG